MSGDSITEQAWEQALRPAKLANDMMANLIANTKVAAENANNNQQTMNTVAHTIVDEFTKELLHSEAEKVALDVERGFAAHALHLSPSCFGLPCPSAP